MIEKQDIKKAVKDRRPIFYEGAEVSLSAFEYLRTLTGKSFNVLFEDFPKATAQHKPEITVSYCCPICQKKQSFDITKGKIQKTYSYDTDVLCRSKKDTRSMYENEIYEIFRQKDPTLRLTTLAQVCDECLRNANNQVEKEKNEFYANPLEWVNTHSPEVYAWQWNKVVSLYTYPIGYSNIPEGNIYCGVKYRMMGTILQKEAYDENYLNWKKIKERTVVERKISTVHELMDELLGDRRYDDTTPVVYRKAVNIAEVLLEGLASGADLAAVLKHVEKESGRILVNIRRNANPTRTFNFGKYKGMTIHEVIEIDAEYIHWALNVVEGFTLTDDEKAHYNGEPWQKEPIPEEEPNEEQAPLTPPEPAGERVQDFDITAAPRIPF